MAELSAVSPARAANSVTFSAADSGGDTFKTTGNEMLLVNHTNDSGSTVTLTVTTTKTVDGEAVDDKTIDVGAGEMHYLGPWQDGYYGDPDDMVTVNYSAATDIEVAVVSTS